MKIINNIVNYSQMFLTSAKRDEISKMTKQERIDSGIIEINLEKFCESVGPYAVTWYNFIYDDGVERIVIEKPFYENRTIQAGIDMLKGMGTHTFYSSNIKVLNKFHEKRNNNLLALASATRISRLGRKSPIRKMGRDLLGILKEFL